MPIIKTLAQLTKFIDKGELEEQGLIQAFEVTHELAWNVFRDYLLEKGHQNITRFEGCNLCGIQAGFDQGWR